MRSSFVALFALYAASFTSAAALAKRNTSMSWAGSNIYFLQGLCDSDQDTYISNLQSYGTKVVRVWINSQPSAGTCVKGSVIETSALELETIIGQYNNDTLDIVDTVIGKLYSAGIKALISPHDANLIPRPGQTTGSNGVDIYGTTYQTATNFYTNSTAAEQYDARINYIMNYVSKSSGKAWKDWPEAIMGFDIENEPFTSDTSICTANDTAGWLCSRAANMRQTLGATSTIKIGTGGIGGDISHDCNFMASALSCPEIDMISVHRYAGTEASGNANWANAAASWFQQVGGADGKKVYVEEWGIDGQTANQTSEWPANTNDLDNGQIPWIYWQVLPPQTCNVSDSDHYGIYMDSGIDLGGPISKAAQTQAYQDWTAIIY